MLQVPAMAPTRSSTCTVTHIDHYTTSFNFAQTNFAAVWLRKGWNLVTNSAVTDVQSGGLNFITGGGYTRSDVSLGEWMLARNSVFIGHTQQPDENTYALDVGPFNNLSGLPCDNTAGLGKGPLRICGGRCQLQSPALPRSEAAQHLRRSSQQADNGYININAAKVDDCSASPGGTCWNSKIPLAWNFGVLQRPDHVRVLHSERRHRLEAAKRVLLSAGVPLERSVLR